MANTRDPLLRVLVDANILVAGIGWPRIPYEVLHHAVKRDFQLVLSPFVIAEAHKHIARLLPNRVSQFAQLLGLADYEQIPDPSLELVIQNSDLVRDQKDVPVALAAMQAKVDYLITQDRDFTEIGESTRRLHQELNIVLPALFLRKHMGWTSEEIEAVRHRNWSELDELEG
jgi:predicted nucleic acid-binding protein